VALSCLVLLWSRVLAAGLSGGVVYEPGPLCVWQCSDTCVVLSVELVVSYCLAALRVLGRPVQFMSVSLVGRQTKFRPYANFQISDVAGAEGWAVGR
jgi:hypothetical protein